MYRYLFDINPFGSEVTVLDQQKWSIDYQTFPSRAVGTSNMIMSVF